MQDFTSSSAETEFGEIFISDRMLRTGTRDVRSRGYRVPVQLPKTITRLEAVNAYLANYEVELGLSGLSQRKQRAAMRKLTKKVNKTYRKWGLTTKLAR